VWKRLDVARQTAWLYLSAGDKLVVSQQINFL
jgi:hypothetical protein